MHGLTQHNAAGGIQYFGVSAGGGQGSEVELVVARHGVEQEGYLASGGAHCQQGIVAHGRGSGQVEHPLVGVDGDASDRAVQRELERFGGLTLVQAHGLGGAIGEGEPVVNIGIEERRAGGVRSRFRHAQHEAAAALVPSPIESGVAVATVPLLEKIAQWPTGFGLKYALQIGGAGRGPAVLGLIRAQGPEKFYVIVQQVAQHVHNGRALLVAQVIVENAVDIGGISYIKAAGAALGQGVGIVEPIAGANGRGEGLQRKVFAVGSKAFVEPDVLPAGAGYVVTKPLVEQLVGGEREVKAVLRGHSLVLHTAVEGHRGMAVLLVGKRVEPHQRRIVFDEAGGQVDSGLPVVEVVWFVNVIDDGNARPTGGVGVVHVLKIGSDGY